MDELMSTNNDLASSENIETGTSSSSTLPVAAAANIRQELPFLVTNWLASTNFGTTTQSQQEGNAAVADEAEAAALARIRHAASELASAFSSLGAFGTAARPNLSSTAEFDSDYMLQDSLLTTAVEPALPAATFADARRRWSATCPANQLESLVQAATVGSASVDQALVPPVHHLEAAKEQVRHQKHHPDSGRTLLDAIAVDDAAADRKDDGQEALTAALSSLQRPAVLRIAASTSSNHVLSTTTSMSSARQSATGSATIVSDLAEKSVEAAKLVRQFLEVRDNLQKNKGTDRSLRKSMALHRKMLQVQAEQRGNVLQMDAATTDVTIRMRLLEEVKEAEDNSNRVLQQLERQLAMLEPTIAFDTIKLANSKHVAFQAFQTLQYAIHGFRDPVKKSLRNGPGNNAVLFNLGARQVGLDSFGPCRRMPRSMGRIRQPSAICESRRAIIKARFSHAVTINTHYVSPVYCLRFDKTGRYFVTGSDDYLAKVFCLATNVRPHGNAIDPATLVRGAILVCTLRGHAAVINDIDVSSDNCFLATASEDGDCRVWGLKDGCPIAILRGHKDGCNMVSWSTLTPCRLVTAAADGYVRCWDVREACLKRYRRYVGKRPEYRLDLAPEVVPHHATNELGIALAYPPLPPLPVRVDDLDAASASVMNGIAPLHPLPPLPSVDAALADPAEQQQDGNDDGEELAGHFVANDLIDEGVQLLAKLRHGASIEEQLAGPGTRSRRAPKVICVTRCPNGGHFASGSDDGICRIWKNVDDERVNEVDTKLYKNESLSATEDSSQRQGCVNSKDDFRLLLNLKGHINAITDLQYSSKGDRLLSASQKDGVVRIWSWNADPASRRTEKITTTHIIIKLSNPMSTSASRSASNGPRRRPVRASAVSVSCDVATWVCDDSKVLTSQGELVKQSNSTIVPGSQYLFIWDSSTGDCLLGFHGAHSMQCPAIIPHPKEPSLFCSAGSDGVLRFWDADAGSCFFTYCNTVDFGPVEANDRGKISGFLDGAFSPDGTALVVTDDNGRVSIFDCSTRKDLTVPLWMREQYFTNDYYDLTYDPHGYCVEKGSGMPPHLAPKGARCSHGGASWSDAINGCLRNLLGPLPLDGQASRWCRIQVRLRAEVASHASYLSRGNIVGQYDRGTAFMIHCDGSSPSLSVDLEDNLNQRSSLPPAQASPRDVHRLSSNWRWGDAFNEPQDDGIDDDEPDADDEDYVIGASQRLSNRLRRSGRHNESDDEELADEDDASTDSSEPRRSGRRNLDDTDDNDEESDPEVHEEYMSTNNSPSGAFAGDYETYFFKMGNDRDSSVLSRQWLRRIESDSAYSGEKIYCPQLGDSVIYVPRAHQDTLVAFPSLPAPWQSWPEGEEWPVVRCCIRHLRYRFPFKSYFKHGDVQCKSIVVVLTLEVTGIPEFSHAARFLPSFISPTVCHSFELTLFENDQLEFLVPVGLYMARVAMVDEARARLDEVPNPSIEVMYRSASIEDTQVEDELFVSWPGRFERLAVNDENLDSGFDAIEVTWENGGDTGMVSAWEIRVIGSSPIDNGRPRLSDVEKQTAQTALAEVMSMTTLDGGNEYNVERIFGSPVNDTKYSDYSTRVEIPMDLSFILQRLAADYYATVMSVVSDVRLIRHNCVKYNGDNDPMTLLANDMVKQVETALLSNDQLDRLMEFDSIAAAGTSSVAGQVAMMGVSGSERRPTRSRMAVRSRSVLEELPRAFSSTRNGGAASRRQSSRAQSHLRRDILVQRDDHPGLRRSSRRLGSAATSPDNGRRNNSLQLRRRGGTNWANGIVGIRQTNVNEHVARNTRRHGDVLMTTATATSSERRSNRLGRVHANLTNSSVSYAPTNLSMAAPRSARLRGNPDDDLVDSGSDSARRHRGRPSRNMRYGGQLVSRTSNNTADADESDEDGHLSLPSRSRRRGVKHETSVEEVSDIVGPDHSESYDAVETDVKAESESDVSVEVKKPKKTSTRASTRRCRAPMSHSESTAESPTRAAGRRRSSQKTYVDPSSSEFDDEDSSDKEEDADSASAAIAPPAKRRRSVSDSKRSPKRAKIENATRSRVPYTMKSWKFVDKRDITALGNSILDRLEDLDADDAFAIPVIEAVPDIAENYLTVIKEPMDFRTIREDRLPWYTCADGLRKDLLLVFSNCIAYNLEGSKYSVLARSMIDKLEDIFKAACEALDVRLPRRW